MTNKFKKPNNSTVADMHKLILLFKDRTNVLFGLTKDQILSLFYGLNIKKIKTMQQDNKDKKWIRIQYIKKYLIRTEQMAIIFNNKIRDGTIINSQPFGATVIKSNQKVFFRCITKVDAFGFRDLMDKIGNGEKATGDNVIDITQKQEIKKEEEIEEREAIKVIQNGKRNTEK